WYPTGWCSTSPSATCTGPPDRPASTARRPRPPPSANPTAAAEPDHRPLFTNHRGVRNVPATPSTIEMAATGARAADERSARDIVVIDVSEQLVITDCFVIVSADTERQVNAVAEEVEDKLAGDGHKVTRREGAREG